jgi:uncharacterized iron-regulated membrane protein
MVKVHRWLAIGLMAWLVVIALTGAWLVEDRQLDAWLHPERFEHTDGDVGPAAAVDAGAAALPEGAEVFGTTLPRNGRGVYQVGGEVVIEPETKGGVEEYEYYTAFVDPGSGAVNGVANDEAGFSWWMYRGHMYLWQDHGILGVFDPQTGWCRADRAGNEPDGVKGVVCDVIPTGDDMVAWFAVGWMVVLLGGFYLWYWPGVKRWANAVRVQRGRGRFAFHMSLHKAIGLVFFVPLTVIAFTGIAFAFPNLKGWYENVTPAQRGFELWVPPDDQSVSEKPRGREPIGLDEFTAIVEREFPDRAVQWVEPPHDGDKRGVYAAWVTRGFDPWTREGGAGNVWVTVDQYTGEVLADETPEAGNVFDQAWSDWSYPLHTGDFGGPVSRAIWVLVGLSPLVLGFTGIAMYLVRRSKHKQRAPTAAPDDAPTQAEEQADEPVAVG